MQVTATEAKNRFGYICAQARTAPVFVEKDGRIDSVIEKEFNATYGEWNALQNEHFEKQGLWCDGLVPRMEKPWLAQFDVYANTPPASRQFAPYVVDVQSDLINQLATRLLWKPVGSLRLRASEVSAALDAVISGF